MLGRGGKGARRIAGQAFYPRPTGSIPVRSINPRKTQGAPKRPLGV